MRRLVPLFLFVAVVMLHAAAIAQVNGVTFVDAAELKAMIERGEPVALLDARSRGAYDHSDRVIKGAIRIVPDELVDRAWELPMGKAIATFCTWPSEASSAGAALFLQGKGFQRVLVVRGGLDALLKAGFPTEPK